MNFLSRVADFHPEALAEGMDNSTRERKFISPVANNILYGEGKDPLIIQLKSAKMYGRAYNPIQK